VFACESNNSKIKQSRQRRQIKQTKTRTRSYFTQM